MKLGVNVDHVATLRQAQAQATQIRLMRLLFVQELELIILQLI